LRSKTGDGSRTMDDGRGKTRSSTFTSTSTSTFSSALDKYRCEYRQIVAGNVPDCLALETSWCNLRHCELDPGLAAEQRAIAACFENWEQFCLIGGAVLVEGRIEAFAIGERLNPQEKGKVEMAKFGARTCSFPLGTLPSGSAAMSCRATPTSIASRTWESKASGRQRKVTIRTTWCGSSRSGPDLPSTFPN
jgi:hypothetical protein